ncbi:MAG: phosphatase PAP2 family protein [Acidobacteriota bacterium]|nr:phosphatase PAP2 family protein [Acidobacteriota bacterium]
MQENSDNKQSSWAKFSLGKAFGLTLQFFGLRLLLGLIAAIISLVLFGWLAEEIFEGATISFDENVRNAVHATATPMLTEAMKIFTFLGSTVFLAGLFVVVAAALYYLKRKRALVLFTIAMVGEVILLTALKASFHRARPDPFFEYALPSSFSFPSGHSLSSFCFYGILAWLVTARMENRNLKILVWMLAAALVLLIGLSRVYLGVHYPSDVLAGYAAGLVWIVTVALGDFFLKRRTVSESKNKNTL